MSESAIESLVMQKLDAKKMKRLREEAGLSQVQAAGKAEMTVSRWNDVESGRRANLTIGSLGRIADVLGCNAQDLLTKPKRPAPRRKG